MSIIKVRNDKQQKKEKAQNLFKSIVRDYIKLCNRRKILEEENTGGSINSDDDDTMNNPRARVDTTSFEHLKEREKRLLEPSNLLVHQGRDSKLTDSPVQNNLGQIQDMQIQSSDFRSFSKNQ